MDLKATLTDAAIDKDANGNAGLESSNDLI